MSREQVVQALIVKEANCRIDASGWRDSFTRRLEAES
jgi:hypothetical protein